MVYNLKGYWGNDTPVSLSYYRHITPISVCKYSNLSQINQTKIVFLYFLKIVVFATGVLRVAEIH